MAQTCFCEIHPVKYKIYNFIQYAAQCSAFRFNFLQKHCAWSGKRFLGSIAQIYRLLARLRVCVLTVITDGDAG